jgi:hypothetical protein
MSRGVRGLRDAGRVVAPKARKKTRISNGFREENLRQRAITALVVIGAMSFRDRWRRNGS